MARDGSEWGTRWRGSLPTIMCAGLLVSTVVLLIIGACGGATATDHTQPAVSVSSVAIERTTTSAGQPGSAAPSEPSASGASADTAAALPTSEDAEEQAIAADVRSCFADLVAIMAPARVFAPTWLPPGATLANGYWPVFSALEPPVSTDGLLPNPYISGTSALPSAEILLSVDDGWLLFLQNFRGDLGDIAGVSLGEVAGYPARVYEIGSGKLVQWSADGCWYGVFARGKTTALIDSVALNMALLQP